MFTQWDVPMPCPKARSLCDVPLQYFYAMFLFNVPMWCFYAMSRCHVPMGGPEAILLCNVPMRCSYSMSQWDVPMTCPYVMPQCDDPKRCPNAMPVRTREIILYKLPMQCPYTLFQCKLQDGDKCMVCMSVSWMTNIKWLSIHWHHNHELRYNEPKGTQDWEPSLLYLCNSDLHYAMPPNAPPMPSLPYHLH
jgi:hypothetical protein